MALVGPVLDNRTFAQLKDELVRRIPFYAPTWTDHNESDPGIALLELFAYLGESLLYRFNQIPQTTKIEFLRLLGVQARPAQTAQVLLAAGTDLAEGVQALEGTEASAKAVKFQTTDEVYVWPLDAVGAGKCALDEPATEAEKAARLDAEVRARLADPSKARFYRTLTVPTDPLVADLQPLDVSRTLDHALWIALLGKPTTEPDRLAGQTLFVGVAFDESVPPPFLLQTLDRERAAELAFDSLGTAPPPMLWELWDGTGFVALTVTCDTTRGLTTTGVVKLRMPATMPAPGTPTGVAGSPPPLPDRKLAARVVGWLRATRPDTGVTGDAIHRVTWVGVNAVQAVQARTAGPELLGSGTGDTGQRYQLVNASVLPGSVRLQVEEPTGWADWAEVDTFVGTALDGRSYLVDHVSGVVTFGGVLGGRVPQLGERIRVQSYRYGGGSAGNVLAGTVKSFTGVGGVTVANPLPARGGADALALDQALEAIPAEVHRHDRAVVAEDFTAFALQVPGVARADVLPLLHPDNPSVRAAGAVTLVVFPDDDTRDPAAPSPDLGLLRRTARALEPRRLLTTELYVVPPTYRAVSVAVGVQVRAGYQVDAVRRWVDQILRQYLAPLPPFGPDGSGWPLGRAVRRAELEAAAVQVDGVEFLQDLRLAEVVDRQLVNGRLVGGTTVETDRVVLLAWEVPELVSVTVVGGPALAPGAPVTPPPQDVVAVPVPPDVC